MVMKPAEHDASAKIERLRAIVQGKRGMIAAVGLSDAFELLLETLEDLDLRTRAACFGARVAMERDDDAKDS